MRGILLLVLTFGVVWRGSLGGSIFDLTHSISSDMPKSPKTPWGVCTIDHWAALNNVDETPSESLPPSGGFCLCEDTGTRLNCPEHVLRVKEEDHARRYVNAVPVEDLICSAYIIDLRKEFKDELPVEITLEWLQEYEKRNENGEIEPNSCVVFITGRVWDDSYFQADPDPWSYIQPAATSWLVLERGITSIVVDSPSIDLLPKTKRKTHIRLFEFNRMLLENAKTSVLPDGDKSLPTKGYTLFQMAMNIRKGYVAPCRTYLIQDEAFDERKGHWTDLSEEISAMSTHVPQFQQAYVRETKEVTELDQFGDGLPIYKVRYGKMCMDQTYSTHVIAPSLMATNEEKAKVTIDKIRPELLRCPCVTIDIRRKVEEHGPAYQLTDKDLETHEDRHGLIPESAIVMVLTRWQKDSIGDCIEKCRRPPLFNQLKCFFQCLNIHYGGGFSDGDGEFDTPKTEEFKYAGITLEACKWLIKRNVMGIGIDTAAIDGSKGAKEDFPCQRALAEHGGYSMGQVRNLDKIPPKTFAVVGPVKIEGANAAPARIVAYTQETTQPCNTW